jgi:tetratricopeptide (TPR) repeat protein
MRRPSRLSPFVVLALACGLAGAPATAAPQTDPQELLPTEGAEPAPETREDRIAEYLRQKEEKRARKEQTRQEQEALELERQQLADEEALAEEQRAASTEMLAEETPPPASSKSSLPKELAAAQRNVRLTSIGADPTVERIMQMIDEQKASPYQLAAFGNFISEHGLNQDALAYYNVALRLESGDPVLWLNLGTLYRKVKEYDQAVSAYKKALRINPNYSLAHYNLGAVFDLQNNYEDAVQQYKIALRLDPTLGDPTFNPQAANNERMIAVKIMLYQEQIGGAGLPLAEIAADKTASSAP